MNVINWTKHIVDILNEDGNEVMSVPPSGYEARIEVSFKKVSNINGIPLFHTIVNGNPHLVDIGGRKSSIPEVTGNTIYIVSGIFRNHFDRPDLYQPGRLIRNKDGQPAGCIGLSR